VTEKVEEKVMKRKKDKDAIKFMSDVCVFGKILFSRINAIPCLSHREKSTVSPQRE
jgi:hypothetical protein